MIDAFGVTGDGDIFQRDLALVEDAGVAVAGLVAFGFGVQESDRAPGVLLIENCRE